MHLLPAPIFAWLPHGMDFLWIFVLGIGGFVVWLLALINCVVNESSTGNTKVVWAIIILFLGGFGGLAYFLFRRPQRIRELGR
jgi:TctA family transporter